jgi:hypothetical protein
MLLLREALCGKQSSSLMLLLRNNDPNANAWLELSLALSGETCNSVPLAASPLKSPLKLASPDRRLKTGLTSLRVPVNSPLDSPLKTKDCGIKDRLLSNMAAVNLSYSPTDRRGTSTARYAFYDSLQIIAV